jgi:GTP-binding protein EngB required for normal cell division
MSNETNKLNESQQRRLRITCEYIDKLLLDVESILHVSASRAAFPKYIPNIPPAQRRTIEDYIARIRTRLVQTLEGQHIQREPASIPATRAIHANLTFVDIAVEELRPRYMRGYGELPAGVETDLNGIVGELEALVAKLDHFVTDAAGEDLQGRLEKLEQQGTDVELLKRLENIITDRGLVEFRSTLAMILERLSDTTFEIAVFGRVSSGKSSLLNAMLGTEVLPVGVTPITAVPTRLIYGGQATVNVWFADRPTETHEVSELASFVAEQHNPGNMRHVTRIMVAIPSPTLRDGISFVDTPGLGSLATAGAAETLAYMPRCDLGVVLVDAASTLTPDDLATVQALYEAGIPANVLLSKADLVSSHDLPKVVAYVKENIRSELGLELSVHPVSIIASQRRLVSDWLDSDISPLFDRRQELRSRSLERKIGALRQSVIAALAGRLRRGQHVSEENRADAQSLETDLRRATAHFEAMRPLLLKAEKEIRTRPEASFQHAATEVVRAQTQNGAPDAATLLRQSVDGEIREVTSRIRDELARLAAEAGGQLRRTAEILKMPDVPGANEFEELIRDMPVLELGPFTLDASISTLNRVFGSGAVLQAIVRQIRKQIGTHVTGSLETYSALFREWSTGVVAQMQRRFEAYASAYRAQIDRSLGGSQLSSEEAAGIIRDLEILGAPQADAVVQPTK